MTWATGSSGTAGCWPRRGSWWWWPPWIPTPAEVVSAPEIITRGWIHAPEAEELLEEASLVVRVALEKALADGAVDQETLRRHARKALGKLVGERTRRRPMIVPVVVIV